MTITQRTSITIIDDVPSGGTAGQVLTKNSNADYDLAWTSPSGTGTVTSVSAGGGLTASTNPITGSGDISIATTGVSAGSYTNANITVNARGQVTLASNGGGGGSVTVSAKNGVVVSGSPGSSITLALNNITPNSVSTGVVSASTVNATGDIQAATGRVTASAATISGLLSGATASFSGVVSANAGIKTTTIGASSTITGSNLSGTNTGDQTITLTGDVSGSGTGSFTTTINPATVTNAKMANMNAVTMKANATTSAASPADVSFSTFLDAAVSAAQGDIIYRGASSWVRLAAGTSGQVLTTQGVSANPSWTSVGGTGTVTSAAVSGLNGITVAGSPITTQGVITIGMQDITPRNITASGAVAITSFSSAGFVSNDASGNLITAPLTISKQFYLSTGASASYPLDSGAAFAYTITKLKSSHTSNGNITAMIQVAGSAVTGLSAVVIDTSAKDNSATGANAVAVGNAVRVVFSSNSAASDIEFTLVATRTS